MELSQSNLMGEVFHLPETLTLAQTRRPLLLVVPQCPPYPTYAASVSMVTLGGKRTRSLHSPRVSERHKERLHNDCQNNRTFSTDSPRALRSSGCP